MEKIASQADNVQASTLKIKKERPPPLKFILFKCVAGKSNKAFYEIHEIAIEKGP